MRVAELHVFPVKSMAGFSPATARVRFWGLEGDRRYMVVRPDGRFLSQRDFPKLALIRAETLSRGLLLSAPQHGQLAVAPTGAMLTVTVWSDTIQASGCSDEADAWLSGVLGTACRLVFLDDPRRRKIADTWRKGDESVSFADGFPVLMTSLASLADLNVRLARPIRINRFRANIVVEGAVAWDEDFWGTIRVGGVTFRVAKPCERCIVTTIEQETAERPDKGEPLRTLGVVRRDPRGVMFGQNLVPLDEGEISVGDPVEILARGPSNVTLL